MSGIKSISLQEILDQLPSICPLDQRALDGLRCDVFICALGFEERCVWTPELLAEARGAQAGHSVYFEYPTNVEENERNKPRLIAALKKFSGSVEPLPWDTETFSARFRELLRQEEREHEQCSVVFDISSCSSSLLMQVLKALLEGSCSVVLFYSEAAIYRPTHDEYSADPEYWVREEGFGLAKGVGRVILSSEHPGIRSDAVAEAVILFPTFNPDRSEALLTAIDESLSERESERICWILGKPHLDQDYWRVGAMREINKIAPSWRCYEVSTFDYRDTMKALDGIVEQWGTKYNVTIAPLGSKLQCVGVALFCYIHQEVSLALAVAERYNAERYSEGCKAVWRLDLGRVPGLRKQLDLVGQIQFIVSPHQDMAESRS